MKLFDERGRQPGMPNLAPDKTSITAIRERAAWERDMDRKREEVHARFEALRERVRRNRGESKRQTIIRQAMEEGRGDRRSQPIAKGQARARFAGVTSDDLAEALPRRKQAANARFKGVTSDDLAAALPKGGKPVSYKVKRGDTLSEIAQKYGTTVNALTRANRIEDPDSISAGRTLKIV